MSSFRGRGGARGGGRGGSRGGRGGRGGFQQPQGPPDAIVEAGQTVHPCEDQLVCSISGLPEQVPYFSGRVFLENKSEIGKVDEILGPLNQMFVSIKMAEGVKPDSLPKGTKVYLDQNQLLPLSRFLPKPTAVKGLPKPKGPKPAGGAGRGGRGGGFRGGRGGPGGRGRGGFRGGRGGGRGGY
eukprot:Protomagalhaensia_sp_Gyna_25__294@NODE_1138_length_2146_cov_102_371618_g903_i0_p1_GENE_NODE_1138_length_2146_cov_102_371618_g903_i0NODE_1138_length_2146_cov_102_371618_g903_i0_p1_ORF_typecomplete_len183_score22_29Gar1/PF04410_14/1_5e30_NODE_1138_length_2146_cov_102_371618_g903_i0388936